MLSTLLAKLANKPDLLEKISVEGLPSFDSEEGERLRRKIGPTASDLFLRTIHQKAEATWSPNWLLLCDAEICRRAPQDAGALAAWMGHTIATDNESATDVLATIMRSLEGDGTDPSFLNAMSRYHYFKGDFEEGDAFLKRLLGHHETYDVTWVLAEKVNALVKAARWDEMSDILADLLERNPGSAPVLGIALRAYAAAGAHEAIAASVEEAGGAAVLSIEYFAYLYLTALENLGQRDRCLAEGLTIVARHPDFFSLFFQLRAVAQSLDKAEQLVPALERAAKAHPDAVAIHELRALAALDRDDFDRVEALIASFPDRRSENYFRFQLTYRTTRPGIAGAEDAYAAYRGFNPAHVGPEIQYAAHLMNVAASDSDVKRAFNVLHRVKDTGQGNVHFVRLYIQTLVALRREEDAETYFLQLPDAAKEALPLVEVGLFFEQRRGQHAEARDGWHRHATSGSFRAVTNTSPLPETVRLRYDPARDQVLLFTCVFNAVEFAHWFLDYYRDLGVDHFFVNDNGSTDGTADVFLNEPDVSLFSQPGSFKESAHGVYWINHLMRTFGIGKWCFFLDMDEAFIFPGMEDGRTLSDLLGYFDQEGYGAVPSFMMDMFASSAETSGGFESNNAFDNSYYSFRSLRPPYRTIQGGFRTRLTDRHFLITKSPLVKMHDKFYYVENNHTHTHLPVADITTTLLHYKFIGNAMARFDEAVERQQHFMGARFYKDLQRSADAAVFDPVAETVTYQGARQLEDLGLIRGSRKWRHFSNKDAAA